MLVATPGQTTSYSTLHNTASNGGGSNSTVAATSTTKKSSTVNSTNTTTSSAAKSLNNNNNHTAATVTTKNSLNSNNTHSTTFNNHQNSKNDNIVSNKLHNNQNKAAAATSSREIISSSTMTAANTGHSLKNENSTINNNNTNSSNSTSSNNKQQSFIQTLKDSVQKALISTTGSSGSNTIAKKYATDYKIQNNCNNSTTSIHNVTSSSSSSSHNNANKVSTTTSTNTSSSSTASATQSSSSATVVRSKYLSCSLSKLHTVAPTIMHRYPEERQHASSTDSLQNEMCHFKPIRIVPKTPWKSGSKSRGNSLRVPKANLATKKIEFVLKSNCDVNNRKKKNRIQNDKINVEEEDDNNEQENKEFYGNNYKPKPSLTCLSTSITTPNHQSAFVCLVTQMNNLANLQSKRQLTPAKSVGAVVNVDSAESFQELYVRKKQKPSKRQKMEEFEEHKVLPKIRSTRLTLNAVKNKRLSNKTATSPDATKERLKQTNAKSNSISKVSTGVITKANKSSKKLGRAKSKTINMIALAATKAKEKLQCSVSMPAVVSVVNNIKSSRKRKMQYEDVPTSSSSPSPTKLTSVKSLALNARKSSRLSNRDIMSNTSNQPCNYPKNQNSQQTTTKTTRNPRKNLSTAVRFSPPLTRSRLKHLAAQGKIVTTATAADLKKPKI